MPRIRRHLAWSLLPCVLTVACGGSRDAASQRSAAEPAGNATDDGVPRDVARVRVHARRDLVESSGAAASRSQPGVFFTMNDSGNDPRLFALDTAGMDRGAWLVDGATNVDWESISVGPCNAAPGVADCVYIGDTGDNSETRLDRAVYRVPEPRAGAPGLTGRLRAAALRYRYDDGPHDVEAMYVAGDGAIYLVTKRPRADSSGRLRPALVFRLAAAAWPASGVQTAERVDSLPIIPGSAVGRLITDGALAADGRRLALRTYLQVFIFATDSATGMVDHAVPPATCDVAALGERQGEGVSWVGAAGRLLLTSEGRAAPLHLLTCPVPRDDER